MIFFWFYFSYLLNFFLLFEFFVEILFEFCLNFHFFMLEYKKCI